MPVGLSDGACEITGKPGVLDEAAGYRCACVSPFFGVFCDGTLKTSSLWRDYRGGWPDVPLPEMPPGTAAPVPIYSALMEDIREAGSESSPRSASMPPESATAATHRQRRKR